MDRCRSIADGFTLLESLVALTLLGAVVVVGLESVGVGAVARRRGVAHAELRLLAERKLEETQILFAQDRKKLLGVSEGSFEPFDEDATWRLDVREEREGSGLFVIDLEVENRDATLRLLVYANRYSELWSERRRAGR